MSSPKKGASSNPFAAPVDEQRAAPALAPKPLSIWLAQGLVATQAPLGVLAIWHLTQKGTANVWALCLYSLLVLVSVTVVLGVQGRRMRGSTSMGTANARVKTASSCREESRSVPSW